MAPALTEPLSPNNTLSASTSSASPRPSSGRNILHKQTSKIQNNGKTNGSVLGNQIYNKASNPAVITKLNAGGLLANGRSSQNSAQKNFGITENNNNNNKGQKSSLFRRSLTSTCAFQSAFEESIKKAGIPLPEEQSKSEKKSKLSSGSAVTTTPCTLKSEISSAIEDEKLSEELGKADLNRIIKNFLHPTAPASKENLSNNIFNKKVKTEPLHSQESNQQLASNLINRISPKNNRNLNNNNNNSNNSNNLNNSIGKLTNGPSSLLSTSTSSVCKSIEAKAGTATNIDDKSDNTNKLMGPMSDTTQKRSSDIFSDEFVAISDAISAPPDQQDPQKSKNILQGFIPIDKDFEEAINRTLRINTNNNLNKNNNNNSKNLKSKEDLLKFEDLQQMDLSSSGNDSNIDNVNISDKKTIGSERNDIVATDATDKSENAVGKDEEVSNEGKIQKRSSADDVAGIIIECDSRNPQCDVEFSQQDIRSTGTTDTTVSASEGENNFLEDQFQDSLQTLCHSQEITPNRLTNCHRSSPKTPTPSSHHLSQIIGTPTSSILTPQSIGLGSVAMGLGQKDYKDSSEMDDQVLSDMDLMQVLKGLDSTTGGDNLCDLAGNINLGLFNDEDCMNYEEIAVPNAKETDATSDARSSIERNHQQMERKCEYLIRRLRKLQARYMGKHVSEEICGLFEWTNRLVRRKDQHDQIPALTYDEDKHRPVSASTMRTLLRKIDVVAKVQHSNAPDSSTQPLKKYKCSSRSLASSSVVNSSNLNGRNSGGGSGTADNEKKRAGSGAVIPNAVTTVIKSFDEKTTDEIGHCAGLLHSELRQVQCAFDSDATASSSGGESADEMVPYNNQLQQPLSITKRAAWRWARDRSAIASRWTWLCAQISDLEYRIRQHNELYQQIRKNKGDVLLESASEAALASTISDQDLKTDSVAKSSSITQSGQTVVDCAGDRNRTESSLSSSAEAIPIESTSNVNGLRSSCSGANEIIKETKFHKVDALGDTVTATIVEEEDNTMGACRTRAFQRSGFRKRKLLQTANVHTVSKKAAKPSTVKCGCQWPFNPCALCTGRPDPTAPRDLPDTMMPSERIALLDPGFHPVLSFTEDVPTSVHIEAILHMPEWQNKLIRSVSKSSKLFGRKLDDAGAKSKDFTSKRPYNKSGLKHRKDSSGPSTSTNKIKKSRKNHDYPSGFSHHSGTVQSPQNSSNSLIKNKYRKHSTNAMLSSSSHSIHLTSSLNNTGLGSGSGGLNSSTKGSINGFQSAFTESLSSTFQCDNLDGSSNGVLPRSKNASPTPMSTGSFKERALERRNRNSYDIDNIVIPYSVAASTRVELLPYKEIPTPKWRVIGERTDQLNECRNDDQISEEIEEKEENIIEFQNLNNGSVENEETETSDFKIVSKDDEEQKNLPDLHESLSMDTILTDVNEGDEDISPEAIQSRHDRALLEERRKFTTYLKFPWSTRSRANRRIDSRAESSGANTPDPTSPASHAQHIPGDQESIPSPAAPATPLAHPTDGNDIDGVFINSGHRRERKRTVSSKKDKDFLFALERRSQSPDLREIVPPYEPLEFPIPDDVFENMLQLMPSMNEEIDDNSNLVSSINTIGTAGGNDISNSNTENFNKKLNDGSDDINSIQNNSISFNLSDTLNDTKPVSIFSSTSVNVHEFCKNSSKNNNDNSLNNNNLNSRDSSDLTNNFDVLFDKNDGNFLLTGASDTDSAESGLEEDPNDPEWKEPVK